MYASFLHTQLAAAHRRRTAIAVLAGSVSCVAFSSYSQAQEASDASDARRASSMEEVIVTAQKRDEKLQDVPLSIAVLGGTDLDRSTGQGVTDALSTVPGVSLLNGNQSGGSQVA